MAEIKPIETIYNGYRFRSRLEAKWAVFFDALHIKYEYEPEGYKLSNGTFYLPDFFLPEFNIFAEVKPDIGVENLEKTSFGVDWESYPGYKTLEQLCDDTRTGGILLRGAPLDGAWYQVALCDSTDSSAGNYFTEPCATFAMNLYDEVVILINDMRRDRVFFARGFGQIEHVVGYREFLPPFGLSSDRCMYILLGRGNNNEDLSEYKPYLAAIAARQARFEHGETPKFN